MKDKKELKKHNRDKKKEGMGRWDFMNKVGHTAATGYNVCMKTLLSGHGVYRMEYHMYPAFLVCFTW